MAAAGMPEPAPDAAVVPASRLSPICASTSNYHVEESYLLDSYDRKGGYSKISTKK